MEPALQGRDDEIRDADDLTGEDEVPQWSPPFRGGMTSTGIFRQVTEYLAAMEPALQGRDDGHTSPTDGTGSGEPQWSPPFRGGMTVLRVATFPTLG